MNVNQKLEPIGRIRTVLVEDYTSTRDLMRKIIISDSRFEIIGEFNNLPSASQFIETNCPDLLLVDLGLPAGSGLILIQQARSLWGANCTSVVLISLETESNVLTAIDCGVKGFAYKTKISKSLDQLVRLTQGESNVSASIADILQRKYTVFYTDKALKKGDEFEFCSRVLSLFSAGFNVDEISEQLSITRRQIGIVLRSVYDRLGSTLPCLSRREFELLQLYKKGFSYKQCASIMGVSEKTLPTYCERICEKLNAKNMRAAVNEARDAFILF